MMVLTDGGLWEIDGSRECGPPKEISALMEREHLWGDGSARTRVQTLGPSKKLGVAVHSCTAREGRDGGITGPYCPVSLAKLVNPRPMRGSVS